MRNKKMVKKTIQSIFISCSVRSRVFVFVIMPFLQGIPYSFRRWDGFSADYTIVGLENYKNVLTDREHCSSGSKYNKICGNGGSIQ